METLALWIAAFIRNSGTDLGYVYSLQCPTLERYASWRAHSQRVSTLSLVGDCCLSVSKEALRLHTVGGIPRITLQQQQGDDWLGCAVDPSQPNSRAVVSTQSGNVALLDLVTGTDVLTSAVSTDAACFIKAPVGRGLVAVGCQGGRVHLLDARSKLKVEHSTPAHPGGLLAMDARGDLLATCGLGLRMGQLVIDNTVKVFDVRSQLRPVFSLPFAAAPALLCFHPTFSTTLLVGSAAGYFNMSDIQSSGVSAGYQVATEGDALTCWAMSSSGEAIAFGGSGGYCHLWSYSATPCVNTYSQPLQPPPSRAPPPTVKVGEFDSFAAVPQHYNITGKLLSDVDKTAIITMGLPPRVIDPSLLVGSNFKQVDFVGYIPNPAYSRGKPFGKATAAVAALRNKRLAMQDPKVDLEAAKVERAAKRAAAGGVVLPIRYKRVQIKTQTSVKFEEFDFSYYNRTRFAGLENNIPNCYCNSLLQVLYFTPAFRQLVLRHPPEPESEFCLTCEMQFLFRMMLDARGTPCQALNLLRALRHIREAAALGLIDSFAGGPGAVGGSGDKVVLDADVSREMVLPRRIASLSRFLLDHLYKEANSTSRSMGALPSPTALSPPSPAGEGPEPSEFAAEINELFCLRYRQKMQTLAGRNRIAGSAEKIREGRVWPIDLQYPKDKSPGKQHATSAASAAPATASSPSSVAASEPAESPPVTPQGRLGGGAASPAGATAAASAAALQPPGKPAFVDLLRASIIAVNDTRAWFDEKAGYQIVRQTRVPLVFPKVLPISCACTEAADVELWQPQVVEEVQPDGSVRRAELPWLPQALLLSSTPNAWQLEVAGGESVEELRAAHQAAQEVPGVVSVLYELTALICHIRDEDERDDVDDSAAGATAKPTKLAAGGGGAASSEGHLVAVVKVQPPYMDEQQDVFAATPGPQLLNPQLLHASSSKSIHLPENLDDVFASLGISSSTDELLPPLQPTDEAAVTTAAGGARSDSDRRPSTAATAAGGGVTASAFSGRRNSDSQGGGGALRRLSFDLPPLDDLGDVAPASTASGRHSPIDATADGSTAPGLLPGTTALPPPAAGMPPAALPPSHTSGARSEEVLLQQDSLAATAATAGADTATSAASPSAPSSRSSSPQGLEAQSGPPQSSAVASGGDVASPFSSRHAAAGATPLPSTSPPPPGAPPSSSTRHQAPQPTDSEGPRSEPSTAANGSPPLPPPPPGPQTTADQPSPPTTVAANHPTATTAASARRLSHAGSTGSGIGFAGGGNRLDWLVLNDFCIAPISASEVRQVYGGQKVPCLLFYTQVEALEAAAKLPPPHPRPALTPQQFAALCAAPPLQGPASAAAKPSTFRSLDPLTEAPHPGQLLALDAEFVALSPPETLFDNGVESQTRPSRLALGRISVLRGEGPSAGSCCIDDYVRAVEPVYDHLTRFSGLAPGDLDPGTSRHYLTTLKVAYLKLRHLVDCGCVFIGHGLKQDFRMLNLTVPPEQVIDTVELLCFKRQRKLSLRFLASYLLGINIQSSTHDSIEDARTALRLYQVYKTLTEQGTLNDKLAEIYRWGKQYGWEPVILRNGVPHPSNDLGTAVGKLIA